MLRKVELTVGAGSSRGRLSRRGRRGRLSRAGSSHARAAALLASLLVVAALSPGRPASAHVGPVPVPERHVERVSLSSSADLPRALEPPALGPTSALPMADHIIVRKSLRRLYLMRGSEVLRSYPIELGLSPVGQKERSGDFRTPEGKYYLTRRNPRSDYFMSIQVSYPNKADLARARHHGWKAGGSIMIHGLPNHLGRPPQYYEHFDWTDGCIAVSDSDMLEIWLMTRYGTPIDILP